MSRSRGPLQRHRGRCPRWTARRPRPAHARASRAEACRRRPAGIEGGTATVSDRAWTPARIQRLRLQGRHVPSTFFRAICRKQTTFQKLCPRPSFHSNCCGSRGLVVRAVGPGALPRLGRGGQHLPAAPSDPLVKKSASTRKFCLRKVCLHPETLPTKSLPPPENSAYEKSASPECIQKCVRFLRGLYTSASRVKTYFPYFVSGMKGVFRTCILFVYLSDPHGTVSFEGSGSLPAAVRHARLGSAWNCARRQSLLAS